MPTAAMVVAMVALEAVVPTAAMVVPTVALEAVVPTAAAAAASKAAVPMAAAAVPTAALNMPRTNGSARYCLWRSANKRTLTLLRKHSCSRPHEQLRSNTSYSCWLFRAAKGDDMAAVLAAAMVVPTATLQRSLKPDSSRL